MGDNISIKEMVLNEIRDDEKIYAFDREYCSDEDWKINFGNESREQAFQRVMSFWETLAKHLSEEKFLREVREFFGDKYEAIINSKLNIVKRES